MVCFNNNPLTYNPLSKLTTSDDLLFWNIAGINNKLTSSLIKKLNEFQIFCFVETFATHNSFKSFFPLYDIVFTPAVRTSVRGRASGGILIFLRNTIKYEILSQTPNYTIIKTTKQTVFYHLPIYHQTQLMTESLTIFSNQFRPLVMGISPPIL